MELSLNFTFKIKQKNLIFIIIERGNMKGQTFSIPTLKMVNSKQKVAIIPD